MLAEGCTLLVDQHAAKYLPIPNDEIDSHAPFYNLAFSDSLANIRKFERLLNLLSPERVRCMEVGTKTRSSQDAMERSNSQKHAFRQFPELAVENLRVQMQNTLLDFEGHVGGRDDPPDCVVVVKIHPCSRNTVRTLLILVDKLCTLYLCMQSSKQTRMMFYSCNDSAAKGRALFNDGTVIISTAI